MIRSLAAVAAGLLLAAFAPAAETHGKVTIRWHGQSFFEIISSKGTRIAIDPHAIEAYGRTEVKADILLVSHEHDDHNQIAVIEIGNKDNILRGLKLNKQKKYEWNPIDKTIKDVHIRTLGTYHDNVEGLEKGLNTIFIIEMDGLHIVHLGDLGHPLSDKQIKEIGPIDVLMIPVGGVYTINGSEAKEVVAKLKPRQYILPMHCGTEVFDDVLPATEFLEDQTNVERYPSNTLTVDASFKPSEAIIAILKWKDKE
jgi:L-ascorbate metabolism protein UlaG (beta-lactamase superfamily)